MQIRCPFCFFVSETFKKALPQIRRRSGCLTTECRAPGPGQRRSAPKGRHVKARHGSAGEAESEITESASADGTCFDRQGLKLCEWEFVSCRP
jgi:hypothetical protein